jgi:hypothetical protein
MCVGLDKTNNYGVMKVYINGLTTSAMTRDGKETPPPND